MATSSISSTSGTSTAADIQAANKAAAQRLLTSLSAGSGVDVASLAQNLVDAERIPKENAINAKIAKNDNKVSGLAAVKFMLDEFKTRLSELKDKSSYNSLAASNSNTSALNITPTNAASAGSYNINISSLAKPQRSISSTGFASATTPINGGLPFDLTLGSSRAGVSTGTTNNLPVNIARIQAPSFGSPAGTTDFSEFKVTVAGIAQTFTPNPASATLADLAADLNTKLNAYDNTLSVTVDSGNLVISSTDLSKRISGVSVTVNPLLQTSLPSAGSSVDPIPPSATASLQTPSFGSPPAADDFTEFKVTVDGVTKVFPPNPASATLADLAADLNTQLNSDDNTLSVTLNNGNLVISSSDPNKQISDVSLTVNPLRKSSLPRVGTPVNPPFPTFMASLSGVSFGTAASTTDFKNFSLTVDGKVLSIRPQPADTSLTALAADIQKQLRGVDGTDELTVTVSGTALQFSSTNTSRKLTNPMLSQATTIKLDTGASVGIPSGTGNSISNIRFGTPPQATDFKSFSVKIGETVRTIIPAPDAPNVAALAADLQKRLRIIERNDDIVVTANGSGISISSKSGKQITQAALTRQNYGDSPEGIVAAINDANSGVKAELINDGSPGTPFKIMVTGATGASETFALSSANGLVNFATGAENQASDAQLTVNGIGYTRKSNTLSDVISGSTIELRSTTTTAASVVLTQDTSAVKEKLKALVVAYNDVDSIVKETTDRESTLETYGKTLVGDGTVKLIRQQLRSMFLGQSSSAATAITSMADLGFKTDRNGILSLDEAKLDVALKDNYGDVVKALTGNQNNASSFSTQPAGVIGDTVRRLTQVLANDGPLQTKTDNAETENTKYKADLEKLQRRMETLLQRYNQQFAAMESLVGSVNAQKTSLKSTFEGMMAAYTNK
jgi:flagellar hook-associated protein 2